MPKTDPLAALRAQAVREAEKLGLPGLPQFTALLFADAVAEDLSEFSGGQLAALAADAYRDFATRRPGVAKIVVANPPPPFSGFTVIDISNDDMPFLVDSTLALLNDFGAEIKLLLHPILQVKRGNKGELQEVYGKQESMTGLARESFMRIHIARVEDEAALGRLRTELEAALADVKVVVLDWRAIQQRVKEAIDACRRSPPPVPIEDLTESLAFLQWLLDNHFTFIGLREYAFSGGVQSGELEPVPESGLGILRRPEIEVLKRGGELVAMSLETREFLMLPVTLVITKSDAVARVHRRVAMDYIGLKLFGKDGELTGELRIVGLFTSSAYTQNPHDIPLLRRKLQRVIAASGFSPESHSGKALNNVLENFPRDELFQIDAETLAEIANGILRLEERPRTRLFVRHDKFDRFVSAFVFIPRDRFNTEARLRAGEILARAYGGHVASFAPAFSETPLVRVHFIIARDTAEILKPDIAEIERAIGEAMRNWDDRLLEAMGSAGMAARLPRWSGAFPPGYTSRISQDEAIKDITEIDNLADTTEVAVEFIASPPGDPARCRLKLYRNGAPIPLSARLPILENLGFRSISETTYELRPRASGTESVAVIHDVLLETANGQPAQIEGRRQLLEDAFLAVWNGRAENDAFNTLVLRESLAWRQAALLRALSRYLRQASSTHSPEYMAQTLVKHSAVAAMLASLFEAHFDPRKPDEAKAEKITAAILQALEKIPSLEEDRIIRRFLNLVSAILRTNYFHAGPPDSIAFKIASRKIEGLPEPRPFAEIFFYAPDVEGIHLRGGPIARGGLRWSDRPEDFRTEVLGLAKAQSVKNAVIVPVGAKGGFVPKKLPVDGSREQIQAEGVRAYRMFVSGLLDLTDNIAPAGVIPPKDTVRRDPDDPYLVVAADKGTAAFSDIANSISEEHGFWLGDAFASGGSAGYDHKKMAITARGGWEAVKRHFREMDTDIQKTPFTVMGVGDMSGDVFGNGMLLSPAIRLVAAFDHRDIFIDPSPDAAASLAERKRLFDLPRSSWQDYDKSLISSGGGVFSRQAKSIALTPQMRELTGLPGNEAPPQAIMKALLGASVDLLWFGGIGTYIKASAETHAEAGDRANDAIRIDAADVRASVIGEGANLGLTQKARIEYALKGGHINTDAVDNSAGVNSSDVEVNIKIALGAAEATGKLDRPARNRLLAAMTDEVAALVLRNNYLQTLCLSIAMAWGTESIGYSIELMNRLESHGLLDRKLEALPPDSVVVERDAKGLTLTRPEFAVLMAYAKLDLNHELLASNVPDDPYLSRELIRYFPALMKEQFAPEIESHRLRREIIATQLANSIINRGGPTFISRLAEETGAGPAAVAAAFAVARDSFGFTDLNTLVDQLDNRIPSALQLQLYLGLQKRLVGSTLWFLRHEALDRSLQDLVERYQKGIEAVAKILPDVIDASANAALQEEYKGFESAGIPPETASRLAAGPYLQRALDIVRIAARDNMELAPIARALFASADALRIDRILAEQSKLVAADFIERRAINRLAGQVLQTHREIVARIVETPAKNGAHWTAWYERHQARVDKAVAAIDHMLAERKFDLARLAVAQGTLADLALQ